MPPPHSLDAMTAQTVGRALDLFGLDTGDVKRWRDDGQKPTRPRTP